MSRWIDWTRPTSATLSFFGKAGALTFAVAVAASYAAGRYGIVFDVQAQQCLPGARLYLVDRQSKEIHRGDIAVFAARGLAAWMEHAHPTAKSLAPFYQDGRRIVKRVVGVPGDQVRVAPDAVWINGEKVGEGLDLAATLAQSIHTYIRDETVPAGRYWLMGSTRDSFDSRYWGYVAQDQILGKAYPIF